MGQQRRITSIVHILVGLILLIGMNARADEDSPRLIVTLDADSLVTAAVSDRDAFPWHLDGRLDLDSAASASHLAVIDSEHSVFTKALFDAAPTARIDHELRVLFNGFVVAEVDSAVVSKLPGVTRVRPTDGVFYYPFLDVSNALIGAPTFWEKLGGVDVAGEDIRIAIIDSGFNSGNPFFDAEGFEMPEGYPVGEAAYTSEKIIAARDYFRPDDPVNELLDEATPIDHIGHGSHCAGIAAGNAGTTFSLDGEEFSVSGVAPRAYLMNYKIFYHAESGELGAAEPEIMAAFEDAVVDGAEIISCSWGGPEVLGSAARSSEVFRAAVDAGVIVVFAAGNGGPGRGTIAYPASLRRVVSVGATSTGRGLAGWLDVFAPEPVPETLTRVPAIKGAISPDFDEPIGPVPLIRASEAGFGLSDDGCVIFPGLAFDGAVALIPRGNCVFSTKINNAAAAGAVAVVITDTFEDGLPFEMAGNSVETPAVLVGTAEGLELEEWVAKHPETTVTITDGFGSYPRQTEKDTVWYSSSRGPTDYLFIKPELLAPGATHVLSAGAGEVDIHAPEWSIQNGTSAAAAHVAGAAALVRQLHPDWDMNWVKSMLIGSANAEVLPETAPPLSIGAGRLSLEAATSTEFVAMPAVLPLGQGVAGDVFEETVMLLNGANYDNPVQIAWEHRLGGDAIAVFPEEGETIDTAKDLVVRIGTMGVSPVGEYVGAIRLQDAEGNTLLRIPYHFRINHESMRDLLLLDMSFLPEEETALADLYRELADNSGLTYDYFQATNAVGTPILAELERYRVIVVFTGNDQTQFHSSGGVDALDHLSSYLRRGGRVVVAGQGPWRGTDHPRIAQLTGIRTDETPPLIDPDAGAPIELDSYLVQPTGTVTLVEQPIDIGPVDGGMGELGLVGTLIPVQAAELPELWALPVFTFKDGVVKDAPMGMVFDPFRGYGIYPEAKNLSSRVVYLGFGFEQVQNDVDGTSSRQELFNASLEWVMDDLDIELSAQVEGYETLVTAKVKTGKARVFEFDSGDGKVVRSTNNTFYHVFDSHGSKHVTVSARTVTGVVDSEEIDINIEPPPDASIDKETPRKQSDEPTRRRDCGCRAIGTQSLNRTLSLKVILHAIGF
ncbi:MAG: S8 family serine peptidase [Deltaproteobacteria bacterium]|nr:S8 family serine peptidase [Deltaproteobacteria bacterium]